jgi:peroxiredoxin
MKGQNTFLLHTQFARRLLCVLLILFFAQGIQKLYAQNEGFRGIALVDAVTKNEVAFSDFRGKKAIAVIFFCNNCPYSTFYVDRIKNFAYNFQDVQFLLINSSNSDYVPEESETAMVSFIKNYGLKVPYLMDKNQKVMNALGAKRCPESFLITPSNWNSVYHGAIDNNPQVAADVSEHYLTDALEEILRGGQVSTPFQRPSGCIIK